MPVPGCLHTHKAGASLGGSSLDNQFNARRLGQGKRLFASLITVLAKQLQADLHHQMLAHVCLLCAFNRT